MKDYGFECGKDCLSCKCCADYDDLIISRPYGKSKAPSNLAFPVRRAKRSAARDYKKG